MKLIYLILLVIALTGCKSKQKLSISTETKTETTEQKDVKEAETARRDSVGHKESTTETVTEGTTIIYDTDKPVDHATGKPPVKSETTWKQGTKEQTKEDSNVSDQTDKKKIDKSTTKASGESAAQLLDEKKKEPAGWPVGMLIWGGVLLAILYCVKNKINPLKWFKK